MSGGAFNYLCYENDLEGLLGKVHDLSDMTDALAHLGYAADAAQETASLLAHIRATNARVEASSRRLTEVWKAMEWWKSCDWGEDAVRQALADYRGEPASSEKAYTLTPEEAVVIDALRSTKRA